MANAMTLHSLIAPFINFLDKPAQMIIDIFGYTGVVGEIWEQLRRRICSIEVIEHQIATECNKNIVEPLIVMWKYSNLLNSRCLGAGECV